MIFETERLFLRRMVQSDYTSLCRMLQDEEVMYAYEHAFSDEEVQEWLERQINRYHDYGYGLWAVILKQTGEMIGQCGLTRQDCGGREVVEIGYLFRKEFWHRGFALEAALGCREYAFQKLKIEEVFSMIRDNNLASQRVAERNGMTVRGSFVKHYYGMDMKHIVYSVKRGEENRTGGENKVLVRDVILYAAMSLDGYLADKDGGVGWLGGDMETIAEDEGYTHFIEQVDTIIMGYCTYHQIVTELSPEHWVYAGQRTYVLTHREMTDTDEIKFVNINVEELISDLKKKPGKGIWLCGGAKVIQACVRQDLVDMYYLTIMPVILGDGIRLFGHQENTILLEQIKSGEWNGTAECVYRRRNEERDVIVQV